MYACTTFRYYFRECTCFVTGEVVENYRSLISQSLQLYSRVLSLFMCVKFIHGFIVLSLFLSCLVYLWFRDVVVLSLFVSCVLSRPSTPRFSMLTILT